MANSGKNAYMGYVYILFPKLLRQALRKSPHSKLTRSKGTSHNIASSGGGRTCEYKCAPLSRGFLEFVIFERKDRATGECKGCSNVRLEAVLDFLRCDFEEGFPNAISDVEYCCADHVFWLGKVCMDGAPCLPRE